LICEEHFGQKNAKSGNLGVRPPGCSVVQGFGRRMAARSKKFQKGFKIIHFFRFADKNRIETFGNAKETIVNLTTHYFIYFCSVLRNKSVSETANKPSYTLLI
jgi:hypothetical protein